MNLSLEPIESSYERPKPISLFHLRLQEIVKNINFNYEQCLEWITSYSLKFGYLTMGNYIRLIEGKDFCREMKDELLGLALQRMDFGSYENYFEYSKNIQELNQKIFLLIMLDIIFDYLSSKQKKKLKCFIVWEVVAKYYLEECFRFYPHEILFSFESEETYSAKNKIYKFFLSKQIDLEEKMLVYTNQKGFYQSILDYFYHKLLTPAN